MRYKTQSPLSAIRLASLSALCAMALVCTTASAQDAAANPSLPSAGQTGQGTSNQAAMPSGIRQVEILSDTQGVNFNPYLKEVLAGIYGRWTGLLPEKAHEPTLAKGQTDIRFTISPDGRIAAMHMDANTHDDQLNRAAWGAISGAQQFPPLPAEFKGPGLELRVHFRVNMEATS